MRQSYRRHLNVVMEPRSLRLRRRNVRIIRAGMTLQSSVPRGLLLMQLPQWLQNQMPSHHLSLMLLSHRPVRPIWVKARLLFLHHRGQGVKERFLLRHLQVIMDNRGYLKLVCPFRQGRLQQVWDYHRRRGCRRHCRVNRQDCRHHLNMHLRLSLTDQSRDRIPLLRS